MLVHHPAPANPSPVRAAHVWLLGSPWILAELEAWNELYGGQNGGSAQGRPKKDCIADIQLLFSCEDFHAAELSVLTGQKIAICAADFAYQPVRPQQGDPAADTGASPWLLR
jgi:hypothetical protein